MANIFLLSFLSIVGIFVAVSLIAKPENQHLVYQMAPEYIPNPLMGLAPWATLVNIEQPHTLVYAELTWRDFEPSEGVYDFRTFENKNQLERWREEGKRVVFRFLMDKPGTERHMDIPEWLFEKTGRAGEYYNHEYGQGLNPDYSNKILIEYHEKVVSALGERYGQDDFFAFVELGSLGHWGEWHVNSESNSLPLPDEATRNIYVQHYLNAFPNTHLLMRRPFNIAAEFQLGLYNDMFGDYSSTVTWLSWIGEGGEFDQTNEPNALSPMPTGWQVAPVGGEQTALVGDEEAYNHNLDQTIQLINLSHMTFIGPGGPYDVRYGSELQPGIDAVLINLGYRIYFEHVQMPKRIEFCDNRQVAIVMKNIGNAPFYYEWPIMAYIFDEQDNLVKLFPVNFDIRDLLPGEEHQVSFEMPLGDLQNGIYDLGIAVLDPLSGEPAIRFAMKNSRQDLIFILGTFEMKKTGFVRWFSNLPGLCWE